MKTGKTLIELAQEIDRQSKAKKDFLVNTSKMFMDDYGEIILKDEAFKTTETFDSQVASKLKIPKQYYNRMKQDEPQLLANNVNTWLEKEPEVRMIRTLDNRARAFLSERYRSLDNYDLLQTALPVLQQNGAEVASCEITDDRVYLKALLPKVQSEIKKGDLVQAGICISNSETGLASLRVEPLIYRLVCENGLITNTSMKKYHVGRSQSIEDFYNILSDKTKEISDRAFWMQVRDIILSAFAVEIFNEQVNKLRDSTEMKIIKKPSEVIEIVQKKFVLNDSQGQDILQHLLSGNDLSKYGLINAITRTASDQKTYDEATRLERLGGTIIELPQKDWQVIADVA